MDQFGCSGAGSGSGSGSSGDDFEIPVWFGGDEKWITGVMKRTTCDDVIYALLCQDGRECDRDVSDIIGSYAVFERWRGVERPLTGRTKLLKVWRAWGMEGSNHGVRFYVRHLGDDQSAFDSSCESIRPRRSARRHHYHDRAQSSPLSSSRHHRQRELDAAARLRESEKTRAFHRLVQLVIEQEKEIQRQLGHMRDADAQVERFETKVHVARLAENGQNYVQDAYLRDRSDESITSGDEMFPEVSAADIAGYMRICERIMTLEDRLSTEEDKIGDLSWQIDERSFCEGDDVRTPATPSPPAEASEARVRLEMGKLREELRRCVAMSREQSMQVGHVDRLFAEYDDQVAQRHAVLNDLLWQVDVAGAGDGVRPTDVGDNKELYAETVFADETKDTSSGVETGSTDSSNELVDVDTSVKTMSEQRHRQKCESQQKQHLKNDADILPHKDSQPVLRRPPSWISPSYEYSGDIKMAPVSGVSHAGTAYAGESPVTSTPGCYSNSKMIPYFTYNTYGAYDERTDVVCASKLGASEDSNSDTGLSSMHSDDQITILETLV